MSFGAIESVDDVEAYYTNIRGGRRPSTEELADLRARYERMGGRSPLLDIMRRQAHALQNRLSGEGLTARVEIGMKFWRPTIDEAVHNLAKAGSDPLVAFTSGPYDSGMSVGSYERLLSPAVAKHCPGARVRLVRSWYREPDLEAAWRDKVHAVLTRRGWSIDDTFVIFSAHALPERILTRGDQYPSEFFDHGRRMAAAIGCRRWGYSYQSAGLTKEPWLGPDILGTLDHLAEAGERRVLVVPIGFVADHLEILNDLDFEARRRAQDLGIDFERVDSLNDSPHLIAMYASVTQKMESTAVQSSTVQ